MFFILIKLGNNFNIKASKIINFFIYIIILIKYFILKKITFCYILKNK